MLGKCNGGHCIEQTLLKGWQEIENIYWQKIVEISFPNVIGSFDHNANSILQIPAFFLHLSLVGLTLGFNIKGRPKNTKAYLEKFMK